MILRNGASLSIQMGRKYDDRLLLRMLKTDVVPNGVNFKRKPLHRCLKVERMRYNKEK